MNSLVPSDWVTTAPSLSETPNGISGFVTHMEVAKSKSSKRFETVKVDGTLMPYMRNWK